MAEALEEADAAEKAATNAAAKAKAAAEAAKAVGAAVDEETRSVALAALKVAKAAAKAAAQEAMRAAMEEYEDEVADQHLAATAIAQPTVACKGCGEEFLPMLLPEAPTTHMHFLPCACIECAFIVCAAGSSRRTSEAAAGASL